LYMIHTTNEMYYLNCPIWTERALYASSNMDWTCIRCIVQYGLNVR